VDRSAMFVRMARRFLDKAAAVTTDEEVKKDIDALSVSVTAIQEKYAVLSVVNPVKPEKRVVVEAALREHVRKDNSLREV